MLHDKRKEDGKPDTDYVHREHHQRFVAHEERIHKEHIHRQAGGARHERHHEHGQRAVFRVFDVARRHDSRHVAAESDQHRHERTSVQAHAVHDTIHQVCHTRHVAAIFHQGDEEEHDDDVRQESEHGTHSLYHTVDEQAAPPRRGHQRRAPFAECVYAHLYPLLRVGTEAERALEDQEEDEYHQREAYPLVGQYLIHFLQRGLLLVVLRVAQTLRQDTVHIRLVGIFIIQVAQVINRVCGRERLVHRLFEQVDDAL